MGSGAQKYYERLEEEENERRTKVNKQYLNSTTEGINNIDPLSKEFEDFKWLMVNKEKIIRNKQLIDLIG